MSILPKIIRDEATRQQEIKSELLRREAEIGGKLFGPVPKGHHRQFFCLDKHTWIWHEEWNDAQGIHRAVTTRYDIRPSGVIKSQDGQNTFRRLSQEEATNLRNAMVMYGQHVDAYYVQQLQAA